MSRTRNKEKVISEKLRPKTAPGLHEEIVRFLSERFPRDTKILDLGAGTGALLETLRSEGFFELHGVDYNQAEYLGTAPFLRADLNENFSELIPTERFGLVTAIEVIEHLENPAHFLRQCRSLLIPEGELVISTPNVESTPGRLKFLASGKLRMFDECGDPTHISPISVGLFHRLVERAELEIVDCVPLLQRWPSSRRAVRILSRLVEPVLAGNQRGDCLLFRLRSRSNTSIRGV